MYAKPNPHFNSYRGVLTNVPPDNGNPDKPHAYDRTCLCESCRSFLHRETALIQVEVKNSHRCTWCNKSYQGKNLDDCCSLKCRANMGAYLRGF